MFYKKQMFALPALPLLAVYFSFFFLYDSLPPSVLTCCLFTFWQDPEGLTHLWAAAAEKKECMWSKLF